jgi:hypothetical protein
VGWSESVHEAAGARESVHDAVGWSESVHEAAGERESVHDALMRWESVHEAALASAGKAAATATPASRDASATRDAVRARSAAGARVLIVVPPGSKWALRREASPWVSPSIGVERRPRYPRRRVQLLLGRGIR